MTAVRGPYSKSSQRPPLTDDQLEALSKGLLDCSKTVTCPNCKISSVFRTKGKNKAPNHEKEYQYLCTTCNRITHAIDMLELVTRPIAMDEDSQSSTIDSQLPDTASLPQGPSSQPTLTQPETNVTPDMQTLFKMLMTLTSELQLARTEIATLKQQLNDKQQHPSTTVHPTISEEEFPALPTSKFPTAPWHQPQQALSLAQIVSRNQEKRETTAARFFQAPSTTQGFQYLYLPTKARIPLGKLRTMFQKLGINNGRLLDLHYPDRNIVAVLVHNDYAPDLTELLSKKGIKLNTTFDPCAAEVLKDPKYATNTTEQRKQIAQELHNQRAQKALIHIRGSAKFAVARFFAHKSWITQTQLDEVLATDPYFAHNKKDPATEDFFVMEDNASAVSATSNMDEDESLSISSQ